MRRSSQKQIDDSMSWLRVKPDQKELAYGQARSQPRLGNFGTPSMKGENFWANLRFAEYCRNLVAARLYGFLNGRGEKICAN